LIGSGKFHAINLALQNNLIYILEGNKISKLEKEEIEKIKTKRKVARSKFLISDKIGILVSTKPGQENMKKARKLKKKLEKQNKEVTIFLADNINLEDLENYDIESWVNTACPALTFDSRIINIDEL
jgi:2-(3-amino-3-carboxypropyl)histidine synthase